MTGGNPGQHLGISYPGFTLVIGVNMCWIPLATVHSFSFIGMIEVMALVTIGEMKLLVGYDTGWFLWKHNLAYLPARARQ